MFQRGKLLYTDPLLYAAMKITLLEKQVMLDVLRGHQIISGAVDAEVLKKDKCGFLLGKEGSRG